MSMCPLWLQGHTQDLYNTSIYIYIYNYTQIITTAIPQDLYNTSIYIYIIILKLLPLLYHYCYYFLLLKHKNKNYTESRDMAAKKCSDKKSRDTSLQENQVNPPPSDHTHWLHTLITPTSPVSSLHWPMWR